MNILALDLGTTTGWAICTRGGVLSGSLELATQVELRQQRVNGFERRLDVRFTRLLDFVMQTVGHYQVDQVIFEDVVFTSSQAQAQLWGRLSAAVWAAASLYPGKLDVQAVPVQTLKVFATGQGSADKLEMRAKLAAKYPQLLNPTADDNEVDAVWLLVLAQQAALGKYELRSIWQRKQLAAKAKRDRVAAKRKARLAKISSY